ASGATAVAAGRSHTCAVVSGAVRCWGADDRGQATPPVGLAGVTALAAGAAHTCAVAGGAVACWGANDAGQAAPPAGLGGVGAVSAGAAYTCALAAGTVRCWGDPGRLAGDGLNGAVALAAGRDFACAADASTSPLRCWGDNSLGQLPGLADPAAPGPPQKPGGGGGDLVSFAVSALASGRTHTCVLREGTPSEGVKCFGGDGALGQLGGTPLGPGELVDVPGTPGAVGLAAGADHGCVILGGGGVACWGANGSGQLGDGTAVTPAAGTLRLVSGL
ncbi:MAG TPA: RCC1 domain-containing protein, partial [Anaeromyxobacteraceae bacterium]